MTDINNFKIDTYAEEEGVWRDLGIGDLEVKLCSMHSRRYRRVRARLEAPHKSDIRKDRVEDDVIMEIARKSIIKGALMDWRNFMFEGEPMPFSEANAMKVFSLDYRPLLTALLRVFADVEQMAKDEREDDEKN